MLWWSLITLVLMVCIVALFPLFKESFSNLQNIPESLESLVGNAHAYGTITGWLSFQVFDQMVFIGIILGIIVGGGILAGEENEGTLQSLLALPVKRSTVYVQKFAALTVIIAVVTGCLLVGSLVGVMLIGESVNAGRLLLCTMMAFLLALVFGTLTYVIGALTGRRGIAGAVVGLFAFASFMISSLAPGISALKIPDLLSPFHYYNKPSILEAGLQVSDTLILGAVCVALLIVGVTVFVRRDIYQR